MDKCALVFCGGRHEICNESTGLCECKIGHVRNWIGTCESECLWRTAAYSLSMSVITILLFEFSWEQMCSHSSFGFVEIFVAIFTVMKQAKRKRKIARFRFHWTLTPEILFAPGPDLCNELFTFDRFYLKPKSVSLLHGSRENKERCPHSYSSRRICWKDAIKEIFAISPGHHKMWAQIKIWFLSVKIDKDSALVDSNLNFRSRIDISGHHTWKFNQWVGIQTIVYYTILL